MGGGAGRVGRNRVQGTPTDARQKPFGQVHGVCNTDDS